MVHFNKVLLDVAIGPSITETETGIIIIGVGVIIVVAAVLIIRAVKRKKRNEGKKQQ